MLAEMPQFHERDRKEQSGKAAQHDQKRYVAALLPADQLG